LRIGGNGQVGLLSLDDKRILDNFSGVKQSLAKTVRNFVELDILLVTRNAIIELLMDF
jgi:hypothetical protein